MLDKSIPTFDFRAFRFLYCSFLSYFLLLRTQFFWETRDSGIFKGLFFFKPFVGPETQSWQLYLSLGLLCASLVLAAIGWRPQLMIFIAWLAHFNIYAPMDHDFKPYDDNIVFFNLMVLSLYPNPKGNSTPSWVFDLIKLNIALVYIAAFAAKIIDSGWMWAEGSTLQNYLYERHFMTGNSIALFFAQNHTLCMFMSVGTLIAEGFFWIVLFPKKFGRLSQIMACTGLFMHLCMYLLMSINFKVFALSYLVFVPYEKIFKAATRRFPQFASYT